MPNLRREKNEANLYFAARLILEEHDNLVNSTSPGLLRRLEAIALELEQIEDRL